MSSESQFVREASQWVSDRRSLTERMALYSVRRFHSHSTHCGIRHRLQESGRELTLLGNRCKFENICRSAGHGEKTIDEHRASTKCAMSERRASTGRTTYKHGSGGWTICFDVALR